MSASEKLICIQCKRTNATTQCALCSHSICKNCTEFLAENALSFKKTILPELTHHRYCPSCFSEKVQPVLQEYNETMARAKKVYIVERPPRKPLPILRKSTDAVEVSNCRDREETIMRLAFLAAERGYNAVIRANVYHEKVRNAGYQKMMWHGKGIPAELDGQRLERSEERSAEL